MFFLRKYNTKTLKLFFLSVIIITLAVIVAVFVGYRLISNKQKAILSAIPKQADISLDKIHQTAIKDGVKQWSLDAGSAEVIAEKKMAIFKDASITFFLKDQKKLFVTAAQGIVNTDTNDIEARGNVRVKHEDYRLQSEQLHYNHKKSIIYANNPVKITGNLLEISADSISLDLNTSKALLKGNVRGTLNEKFSF